MGALYNAVLVVVYIWTWVMVVDGCGKMTWVIVVIWTWYMCSNVGVDVSVLER